MKSFFLFCCQLLIGIFVQAQTSSTADTAAKAGTRIKVESESQFPGGQPGWIKFLNTHFVYPSKAERKKIEGTVLLQFIVEADGTVTNIEAESGPELLKDAAIDMLKQSPRWVPAVQDGKKVKSYKKQPITFRLQ